MMYHYNYPYYYYKQTPNPIYRRYPNNYISKKNAGQLALQSKATSQIDQKEVRKHEEISQKSNDNAFFEIFGIKLYFDDILLICLIFFLYNEGVQDQYLFIALILLLLS